MVVNLEGAHFGSDGTSKSISNNLDLALLMALRSKSSVIVTTGETARKESYRSSRFAPLAFITKNPQSLADLPAIKEQGSFENIFLKQNGPNLNFNEITGQLKEMGFNSFLFEGGPSSLQLLLNSSESVKLVFSFTNTDASGRLAKRKWEPLEALSKALPEFGHASELSLEDDFEAGQNRVITWVKPAH
jgi:riboflavin biosynthesis pyrimidine reductase